MAEMPPDPVPTSASTVIYLPTLTDSTFITSQTLGNVNMSRLGGPNPTGSALSHHQLEIVRSIALCCSTISLVAAAVVLHWFFRMKRNFRRQLIMILIICDSFKTLWSFIFPIVALTDASVATGTQFCSASGFFFATGIESTDFCILFIAIHSALCIFMPRTGPISKSGLYRYRYIVYCILFLVPITMASLAFVNDQPAYVAQTTWCYLPVRPFWFRLALAWIPRYIIMVSVTSLYLAIYIYVKVTFRANKATFRSSEFNSDTTQPSQIDADDSTSRRGSNLSVFGATFKTLGLGKSEKVREEDVGLDDAAIKIRRESEPEKHVDPDDLEAGGKLAEPHQESEADQTNVLPASGAITSKEVRGPNDDRRGTDSTNRLTSQVPQPQTFSQSSTIAASPTDKNDDTLRQRQYAIQRQLRFLFIYPCVYVLIWLVPLINHSLQYYERFAVRPSFPLVCMSSIALPIQGAVYCLLFSIRERPWRLVRKRTKQPFVSWVLRRNWEEPSKEDLNIEAMDNAQRHAYLRREREKKENEEERERRAAEKKKRGRMGRKNSMTWWDTFEGGPGGDISRQPSRQDGEPGGDGTGPDGKALTRNSSFSSLTNFGTIGRRRSRSGSDIWKNFSFSDMTSGSNRPKLARSRSSLAELAPGAPASGPGPISAIAEEHPELQSPVEEVSPESRPLPVSRNGDEREDDDDDSLMMKK
ncbi:hypothetical protein ABW19_dt0208783 [Dactylella cylindrospora]|nr:hypothetical protein ABW19_dt0208783 [Dactylella cylindrospora]